MKLDHYCGKCIYQKGQPGIRFDDEGICHVCRQTEQTTLPPDHLERYQSDLENYMARTPSSDGGYDALLMLSGGKDSIYMLLKAIEEHRKNVLAFTYNHPYESPDAARNITKVQQQLDVPHVCLTAHTKYRQYMRQALRKYQRYNALGRKSMPGNSAYYLHEKQPCGVCTSYMMISAYFLAFRMRIPYILYCADPYQMEWMWQYDIRRVLRDNDAFLGKKFNREIFGSVVDAVLAAGDEDLPRMVFPYITMLHTYDADAIITELQDRNLYDANIYATHCTLWSFINYYAYKNFDMFLYTHERAKQVRDHLLSREREIETQERLRRIFLEIAPTPVISEEQKAFVRETFTKMENLSASAVDYLFDMVINTRKTAHELGFSMDDASF